MKGIFLTIVLMAVMLNRAFCDDVQSGNEKYAKGDLTGAMADYNKAIELKSDNAEAYTGRGNVKQVQGDLDGAITDFTKAINLKPNVPNPYFNRGNAKKAKGEMKDAVADFTKVIELQPDAFDAYNNRGTAKQTMGDLDGAVTDFNKAIELKPSEAESYYNRGYVEKQRGDLNGALADFTKIIVLFPKNPKGYYSRGSLHYEQHAFTNALIDFQKASELDTANDYARFFIWQIQTRLGDQKTATKELQTYLENRRTGKPDDWPSNLARFLIDRLAEPDFFKALVNVDKEVENGQRCEAYFYAGIKRLIAGDKIIARDYFEKCLATGEKDFGEYQSAMVELKFLKAENH